VSATWQVTIARFEAEFVSLLRELVMLGTIFPKTLDNAYRGHPIAGWLLALLSVVKTGQGLQTLIDTRHVALGPDGIPVDTFGAAAANEVLSLLALLGMYVMIVPILSLIALVRYRAMVPLMYLLFIAVQLGARLINYLHADGNFAIGYGTLINFGILAATCVGFILSLTNRLHHEP
jgi:hypothetical protein